MFLHLKLFFPSLNLVFGSNRSILKPSTLFTDANVSSPSVTFGNYSSKVVKLKPSVLTNPFVNSKFISFIVIVSQNRKMKF